MYIVHTTREEGFYQFPLPGTYLGALEQQQQQQQPDPATQYRDWDELENSSTQKITIGCCSMLSASSNQPTSCNHGMGQKGHDKRSSMVES